MLYYLCRRSCDIRIKWYIEFISGEWEGKLVGTGCEATISPDQVVGGR